MSPGFSERYLLQPEQFAHELGEYRKYISAMIAIADPPTDADQFADEIVDFSKALAKVCFMNNIGPNIKPLDTHTKIGSAIR